MSLNFYTEEEDKNIKESINNYKDLFSEFENKIPTLSEALNQMFKSVTIEDKKINELTQDIIDKSKIIIDKNFEEIKKKYNNITKDDAYIISSYTCESKESEYSPYKILNKNLVSKNRKNGVENIAKYLYIFLKSLRKLKRYYPTKTNKYLYRCITHKVTLVKDPFDDKIIPYMSGNQKTFWGFTSTSTNPKTAYQFLKNENKNKAGTIFTLQGNIWGYDIELFNYYYEKEILLEPEKIFIVDNVLPEINGVISVTCTLLKSPLILENAGIEQNYNLNNIINEEEEKIDENINFNYSEINKFVAKIEMELKINDKEKYITGIGLLCNIFMKNIKVLMTYNHLIDYDILNELKKLSIVINNKEIEIDMKINRYKYTNKELDITIIEILNEDNINDFMNIDKYINSKNYVNEDIFSIYLKDNKKVEYINSIIKSKKNDNYLCPIGLIKEGIIILKYNLKLIGLIKESNNEELEFIPMHLIINKINFIKCKYIIKKIDFDKPIQIFNIESSVYSFRNEEIYSKIKVLINGEIFAKNLIYKFYSIGTQIVYLISDNLLTNMSFMFYDCTSLIEIDLSSYNTNQVTDMSNMFSLCKSLKEINATSIITSNVINMANMFSGCSSLKEINLLSFDTNRVTNMYGLFYNCSSLKKINLSSFKTNQLKNMSGMFSGCSSLEEINLSSFRIKQVTDMSNMFYNCSSLKKIDLSSFKENKVTNLHGLFFGCSSLKEIDLSLLKTKQINNISNMFNGCSSLIEINLSSFDIDQNLYAQDIFNNCSSLKTLKCKNKDILNNYKGNLSHDNKEIHNNEKECVII